MADWRIVEGGLDDPRVIALVELHRAGATATLPPQANHAAALDGLKAPPIRFFVAWAGDEPLATGAIKRFDAAQGEVKSMFTAPAARGQGAGSGMLAHLFAAARADGLTRLSLATHPFAYFAPAIALYRRHGFTECPPFADYTVDPASLYMTREL
ncbi:MAG: GNAT family N-acetyltransferase [Sphingomonadales bacterium]|nr:GNAT family N-acetyltransferase [Sphingomonadales bacterium]